MTIDIPPRLRPELPLHPAAELFPLMEGADFNELVADIRENGLLQPIVRTPSGAILDGRNRWHACQLLGIKPKYVVHKGDPWQFAIGMNLPRRNLTHNHRAMIAATLADRARGNYASSRLASPDLPPTRRQAEQMLSVSVGSLDRAKRVVRDGTSSLRDATAAGLVRLTTASRMSQLPPQAQDEFVAKVRAGAAPRQLARQEAPAALALTRREARYRYVQEPALRVIGDALGSLGIVLTSAEGLDPALTAEQAAQWRSDLSRRAKSLRQLMILLKERSG